MINKDVAKLIRKSALPIMVGVLTSEDVVMVRAYKNDILKFLAENPLSNAFDPSVTATAIFLHNAESQGLS